MTRPYLRPWRSPMRWSGLPAGAGKEGDSEVDKGKSGSRTNRQVLIGTKHCFYNYMVLSGQYEKSVHGCLCVLPDGPPGQERG